MKTVLIILGVIIGIIMLLGIGIIEFFRGVSDAISYGRYQDDTPAREPNIHNPEETPHENVRIKDIFTITEKNGT